MTQSTQQHSHTPLSSGRKQYIKKQPANWYRQNTFFTLYMLRELTAVSVALEALNIFWGLASLAGSLTQWQLWLQTQTNPIMIILHIIAIIAALYNSATWFDAMPKAIRIQKGEKFIADNILIGGSWATLFIILIALFSICLWLS